MVALWALNLSGEAKASEEEDTAEATEADGAAPAGCALAGTSCRLFAQQCVYTCGDGGQVSRGCGSCLGWWDPPPSVE